MFLLFALIFFFWFLYTDRNFRLLMNRIANYNSNWNIMIANNKEKSFILKHILIIGRPLIELTILIIYDLILLFNYLKNNNLSLLQIIIHLTWLVNSMTWAAQCWVKLVLFEINFITLAIEWTNIQLIRWKVICILDWLDIFSLYFSIVKGFPH